MKKILFALLGVLMFSACGVGSYSVASGKADEGMISFISKSKTPITVTIDNTSHHLYTVKTKAWQKDRKIKKTAQNTVFLAPGQHDVVVTMNGKEVCNKKVFVSVQEHRVVEL